MFSRVQVFVIHRTVAHRALCPGFSQQEHWGNAIYSSRDLPELWIKSASLMLCPAVSFLRYARGVWSCSCGWVVQSTACWFSAASSPEVLLMDLSATATCWSEGSCSAISSAILWHCIVIFLWLENCHWLQKLQLTLQARSNSWMPLPSSFGLRLL